MKELLLQYAQYNVWANKLIIDVLLNLEDGAADREINSSFPSLRKTVLHTWSAESIWLERLQLVEQPIWQQGVFTGTFEDACINWQQTSADIVEFVEQKSGAALHSLLSFKDRQGSPFEVPNYQVLYHVFNHSTYHRGQFVTMLRQVGATEIPGTDFIGYVRLK